MKRLVTKHLLTLLAALLLAPWAGLQANPVTNGTFNVRQYGAVGDGKTLDTAAIQKAVDAAASAGGGNVVFPPGTYLSSSVRLLSHVTLQIEKGATLLGSPARTGYQKAHFYALLLADGQTNIGIRGEGTIVGNGKLLAADTQRLADEGVLPDAREGNRPLIINFRRCKNVTIRGITLRDSAMWVQDYRECEDVLIENITVRSNVARNNDGLDLTDCKRVVVRGCDIDSEDDGICPKSSSSFGCEDMLIENCRIRSSCNGLKFGTASVGGFRNVTVRNLDIYDTCQSAIALEIVDGGAMENVRISNIKITDSNNPLFIRLGNRNFPGAVGSVRGITISNVTAEIPLRSAGTKSSHLDFFKHYRQGPLTGLIVGLPGHPIRDVKLRNISITYGGIGDSPEPKADAPSFMRKQVLLKNLTQVPQQTKDYPEAWRFGIVPAWGFYIRRADGIELDNVTVRVKDGGADYRAALLCDDVKNISLQRFNVLSAGTEPVIVLHDVQGATIRDSVAPPKAVRFIETMGNTSDVVCGAAESLRLAAQPYPSQPAKANLPDVGKSQGKRYNVLFVAVDDLNDWVGCLGGNPQAITPNMDRLAKQQAMVMNKAYAPSTVCCPSRTSLLTGKRASSTGVYSNQQNLKNAPKSKDVITLPEYFGKNGYHTVSAGKIFHGSSEWAFQEVAHPGGGNKGMVWQEAPSAKLGVKPGANDLTWGACKAPVEETKDYLACKWAADQLQRDFDGKPFFLALGICKPHLPWFVPQQFFDLYPLEKIKPVEIFRDDLDDIVKNDGKPVFKPNAWFELADKANMHKEAQRAYLANISYVDYCLGVLFDALEKSKYADDTIIMLWGDHGWHLSEKLKYGKIDLWEESARVPFIVSVPGLTPRGSKCDGVVNLLDMYPTLVELCGLPPNAENEGRSFAPLLKNPQMEWNHPTLTTYQFKNHSLTDGRYRYTWYGGKADGADELYDHSTDPLEHKNLAANPESKEIIARFKKHLPTHNELDSPRNGPADGDKKAMRKGGKANDGE